MTWFFSAQFWAQFWAQFRGASNRNPNQDKKRRRDQGPNLSPNQNRVKEAKRSRGSPKWRLGASWGRLGAAVDGPTMNDCQLWLRTSWPQLIWFVLRAASTQPRSHTAARPFDLKKKTECETVLGKYFEGGRS